jgi:voltage-gated potassium channel
MSPIDVVMHDETLDYRLEQIDIGPGSAFVGRPVDDAAIHDRTGALLLALRRPPGPFLANPTADTPIESGSVLIVLGTAAQLAAVRSHAGGM